MPTEARKNLLLTADNYPLENLPGYPVSGVKVEPPQYPSVKPTVIETDSYLWDPYFYRYPPYLPPYYGYPPLIVPTRSSQGLRKNSDAGARKTDDPSSLIPGTGLTKQELDDRIMSQLNEHRLKAGEKSMTMRTTATTKIESDSENTTSMPSTSKLLSRREKIEEKSLKKSVTFQEAEEKRIENVKSNHESHGSDNDDDDKYDDYGNPVDLVSTGVNTDSSLLFYRSPGIKGRPKWNKYWGTDTGPAYVGGVGGGGGSCAARSYSPGPFRETALQAPLEVRDQRTPPYDGE